MAYKLLKEDGGAILQETGDFLLLDLGNLMIKGDTTFAVNDILVMRGITDTGIQEEWMRVLDATNDPSYTVARDLAGLNPTLPNWKAGTPIVKQGSSDGVSAYSGGWLRLIGEGTNSPYYSVFARTGVAYNAYVETARFGNLNGFLDYSTDLYGIAIGDSNANLCYETSNGFRLRGISNQFFQSNISSNLRTSADNVEVSNSTTVRNKVKEILFNDPNGTITVKCDMYGDDSGYPSTYYVYKNGVATGAAHQTTGTNTYTFSDNISFNTGDLIQIYVVGHTGSPFGTVILNFRLYYDVGVKPLTNTVNIN